MSTQTLIPVRKGTFRIAGNRSDGQAAGTEAGWLVGAIGLSWLWNELDGVPMWRLTHLPSGLGCGHVKGTKAFAVSVARDLNPLFTEPGAWDTPPPPETYAGAVAYMRELRQKGLG